MFKLFTFITFAGLSRCRLRTSYHAAMYWYQIQISLSGGIACWTCCDTHCAPLSAFLPQSIHRTNIEILQAPHSVPSSILCCRSMVVVYGWFIPTFRFHASCPFRAQRTALWSYCTYERHTHGKIQTLFQQNEDEHRKPSACLQCASSLGVTFTEKTRPVMRPRRAISLTAGSSTLHSSVYYRTCSEFFVAYGSPENLEWTVAWCQHSFTQTREKSHYLIIL
jgi:hypothetical protein